MHHTEPAELLALSVIWDPPGPLEVSLEKCLPTALSISLCKAKDASNLPPPSISLCLHADPWRDQLAPWVIKSISLLLQAIYSRNCIQGMQNIHSNLHHSYNHIYSVTFSFDSRRPEAKTTISPWKKTDEKNVSPLWCVFAMVRN